MNRRHLFSWSAAWSAIVFARSAGAQEKQGLAKSGQAINVEAVQMPAWINTAQGRRPLEPGSQISSAQEVQTAKGAALVMRLPEGSVVRLGEATRLAVERLSVDPGTGRTALQARMRLFDGFFRFATSAVAKVAGERRIEVQLRTATIGIRGTDFWSMTDDEHDAACLFEGNINLSTRDQGSFNWISPRRFGHGSSTKHLARSVWQALRNWQNFLPAPSCALAWAWQCKARWRVVALASRRQDAARQLMQSLRAQGYPAVLKQKEMAGQAMHEVRINALATREDAQYVLDQIGQILGFAGE